VQNPGGVKDERETGSVKTAATDPLKGKSPEAVRNGTGAKLRRGCKVCFGTGLAGGSP